MKRRQSKKRFCYEYIQPITNSWKLTPAQSEGVMQGFYQAMGGYGRKPNLMNPEDHKKLITTASKFISETRKKIKSL